MTKQHAEPLQRLETLAAENATLKLQLKETRYALRLAREELAETVAIADGAAWRERDWPNHLNAQQKVHQMGLLLAQLFTEPEIASDVKEAFGDAIEQLARRCQAKHPRLVQALEARYVFPQIALALTEDAAQVVSFHKRRQA